MSTVANVYHMTSSSDIESEVNPPLHFNIRLDEGLYGRNAVAFRFHNFLSSFFWWLLYWTASSFYLISSNKNPALHQNSTYSMWSRSCFDILFSVSKLHNRKNSRICFPVWRWLGVQCLRKKFTVMRDFLWWDVSPVGCNWWSVQSGMLGTSSQHQDLLSVEKPQI